MIDFRHLASVHDATPRDYVLVSTFGVGDTYLIAALCAAFRERYCRSGERLILVVPEGHHDLAGMFSESLDGLAKISSGEARRLNHTAPRGQTLTPGVAFMPHPQFVGVRSDYPSDPRDPASPPAHGRMSDAAMFAMIMGLRPDAPLTTPRVPTAERALAEQVADQLGVVCDRTVVLVDHANSWPAPPDDLWTALTEELSTAGWRVLRNDPSRMPMRCLLPLLEICGWVVGANCGLMQTLVLSRARLRKTVLTSSRWLGATDSHGAGVVIPGTCAYGFRKADGRQYDIDEFRVDDDPASRRQLAVAIASGRMSTGPVPDPSPLSVVEAPVSPGEVLDRLTILQIKRDRLPAKAPGLYRDIAPLCEIRDGLVRAHPEIVALESELRRLNEVSWDGNEILIETFADDRYGGESWTIGQDTERAERTLRAFGRAHRGNQRRVRVKNEINRICLAGREEKSYET